MKRYENDDDIPTSKSKNCIVCLERRFRGSIADAVELGWLKTKKGMVCAGCPYPLDSVIVF